MKFLLTFCVILFAWGSTADSYNDLSAIEQLVSNEIGHENYSLAEIILEIIDRFRDVINDAVKDLLESQRHLILTGVPPVIPPFDPFYIDEYLIEPTEQIDGFSRNGVNCTTETIKSTNFKLENCRRQQKVHQNSCLYNNLHSHSKGNKEFVSK
ncbi:hypothetical protein ACKWTF_000464 [Chironomus riparius]